MSNFTTQQIINSASKGTTKTHKPYTRVVQEGFTPLSAPDAANCIYFKKNVLAEEKVKEFIQNCSEYQMKQYPAFYGNMMAYEEICFTPNGDAFRYAGKSRMSQKYPPFVLDFIEDIEKSTDLSINECYQLANSILIHYSPSIKHSGKLGYHSDKGHSAGDLIFIYSLGQTRNFLIRSKTSTCRPLYVQLPHNSVLAMIGSTFQDDFEHSLEELDSVKDEAHHRLSFNVRFKSNDGKRKLAGEETVQKRIKIY